VICLETYGNSISNTKFFMYYFKNMSSLKINYHKSDVMVMGYLQRKVLKLLGC
jgi:hypothetical protein